MPADPAAAKATKAAPAAAAPAAPRKVRFNVGQCSSQSPFFSFCSHIVPPGTQYQVLDVVGEGAYGIVCSAVHRPSGRKVAIKKIAPFDHSMFCLRTLRELKLLKFLSEAGVSENVSHFCAPFRFSSNLVATKIISILDIVKPSSLEAFKEVYRAWPSL